MTASRREFFRSLTGVCTLAACGLWLPRHAWGSDLGLLERLARLHNNQLSFDRDHKPQISIALYQGEREVRLSSPHGLELLPSGVGGPSIRGASRWRIRLADATPCDEQVAVVLGGFAPEERTALAESHRLWKRRGIATQEAEVGAVFGVKGTVVDTRRVLVCSHDIADRQQANRLAARLQTAYGIAAELHARVVRRAFGSMIAEDLDHGVTVRIPGAGWFAPTEGEWTEVALASGSGSSRYRGDICVAIDRTGQLTVVNRLDETGVLSGIVPAEMFASAPEAALGCQAVAARGQLLARIGTRHRDDPFLLCADQHCQVYGGMDKEHPRSTAAVRRTAGQVLMRPSGSRMANTVYSANSGGHTENNEDVWPSEADPVLRGRADPKVPSAFAEGIDAANLEQWLRSNPAAFCHLHEDWSETAYRWRAAIDPHAVANQPGVPPGFRRLESIEVLARGRSGRATAVRLVGAGSSVEIHRELAIRRALGGLRSSLFLVLPERDANGRFQLIGGGHGHGVGMCQHGAVGMARAGRDMASILGHYYQGARLTTLW